MRRCSPTISTSVWRLPMCQARRASACGVCAVTSTKGSRLPATRTIEPSSRTRPSPSRSTVACGRSSRNEVPPSAVSTMRRRWRSPASSTMRSMTRDLSSEAPRRTEDARRSGLFKRTVLGKKFQIKHFALIERALLWEYAEGNARLIRRKQPSPAVCSGDLLLLIIPEAGAVSDDISDLLALLKYGIAPAGSASTRLEFPFQEMSNKEDKAAANFALLRGPHAFHLVHQIVQVEIVEAALAQQPRLLLRPGEEVALVEAVRPGLGFAVGHACSLEQKVALRHRQHLGGRAGEELAVGAHLVGFRVDLDAGRGAVVHHALFGDAAAGVLHRDELLLDAELAPQAGLERGLRHEHHG